MSASYYHELPRTTTYYHILSRSTTYYHILPRTTTYYHVLPRTTTYQHVLPRTNTHYHVLPCTIAQAKRSFCISGSHPCMSALLLYCFTILLFYFTPHTVLPRPMFGVGGPRCEKNFASRAATLLCRPRTTYYHVLPRTTTYYHPRTTTYYSTSRRSCCISDSQPQTSAAKFLHLGQPTADIGRKVFASRTASPACRPAFLHVGRTHPPTKSWVHCLASRWSARHSVILWVQASSKSETVQNTYAHAVARMHICGQTARQTDKQTDRCAYIRVRLSRSFAALATLLQQSRRWRH